MVQTKSSGRSTQFTMNNESSAIGKSKLVCGENYEEFSKFEDAPGQINIFETSEELFDWTGNLADSCQAIVVNASYFAGKALLAVGLGAWCSAVRARNGEFHGSVKDMLSQAIGAVVDDRSATGRLLGDMGAYYDQLMKSTNGFGDIMKEHIDVSPWMSAGKDVRKTCMGEVMTGAVAYIEENQGKTALAKMIEKGLDIGGFKYVEYDDGRPAVFESTIYPMVQRGAGFSDWVDSVGSAAGMDIDDKIITFKEGNYEYRVELWKGSYGLGGTTGAEIGLYCRPIKGTDDNPYVDGEKNYYIAYQVVPEDKYCVMSYTLHDNATKETVFTRDTRDDSQEGDKGWWPLTMRAGYVSEKENLVMKDVTIEFWSEKMAEKFVTALENYKDITILERDNDRTVKYTWGKEETEE